MINLASNVVTLRTMKISLVSVKALGEGRVLGNGVIYRAELPVGVVLLSLIIFLELHIKIESARVRVSERGKGGGETRRDDILKVIMFASRVLLFLLFRVKGEKNRAICEDFSIDHANRAYRLDVRSLKKG